MQKAVLKEGLVIFRVLRGACARQVALAYWLAEQQDNIRPGDALPTPSARDEDGTVSVDENPEVYSLGVPVRLQVGPVGDDAAPRTFYVRPAQGDDSSRLVTVSVERPCGVVFEQSEDGSVFVAAVQAQSNAARQARLAQLVQRDESFQVGDVLRAFVTTNTVYDARAQLGVSLPQRELQFVSLDDYRDMPRSWQLISEQLGRGRQADGPAQFVLERQTSSPS